MNEKRKKIIERVLEKIRSGEIVDGDKLLPERKLAEILNEARPTMREALIALEAMGVLDIRDRQGIFLSSSEENKTKMLLDTVRGLPADSLSRGMEMRQILDPPAAALAAERHNEEDIKRLGECLTHIRLFSTQDTMEAAKSGSYWNTVFHTIIVSASRNKYLTRVYEGIFSMLEHDLSLMRIGTHPLDLGGRELDYREHLELFRLIRSGDAVKAELFAEEHLAHTVKAMVRLGQIVPSSDLYSQGLAGLIRFKLKDKTNF